MKKIKQFIIPVIMSFLLAFVVYASNTFPTTENNWQSGDVIEEGWANSLETRIGANATTSRTTLTYQVNTLMATTSFPFLNTIGTITTGVWQGTAIGDSYITKTGNWTGTIDGNNFAGGAIGTGELIYGGSAGSFSELAVSTNGYVLTLSSGVPVWVATTTFNSPLSYSAGVVSIDAAGDWTGTFDGQQGTYYLNFNNLTNTGTTTLPSLLSIGTTTGFAYLNSGQIVASSTIGASWFLTTGNWSGVFDNQEGSYYLNFANLTGTGTTSLPSLITVGTTTGFAYLNSGQITASSTIGAASFLTTGNWSGVFDNQEGSYYLDSRNLTNTGTSTLPQLSITASQVSDFNTAVDSHLSGGEGITYTTGAISFDCSEVNGAGLSCVGEDMTLNMANANTWTALQTFGNASTTNLDITGYLIANTASSTFAGLLNLQNASSTSYYGGMLTACSGASNALQWTGGNFSCGTITAGSAASSTLLADFNNFTGDNNFHSASSTFAGLINLSNATATQFSATNFWLGTDTQLNSFINKGLSISSNTLTVNGTSTLPDLTAIGRNGNLLTITGRLTVINASSTNLDLSGYLINNSASSTISNLKTSTLSIASDGTLTVPSGFGGRSLTVNGTALDADAELYIGAWSWHVGSSTVATSTNVRTFVAPVAMTLTNAYGHCNNAGTTSIMLEANGTNLLDDLFSVGYFQEASAQMKATTTFADATIAAGQVVSLDYEGYFINNAASCDFTFKYTKDD